MKRNVLEISNPCGEDFQAMEGEGARRFCGSCEKHVHDLSAMTLEEAKALIRENAATGLCVTYRFDHTDRILFRPRPTLRRAPRTQLDGARRLLAAAALVPLLAILPACDAPTQEDPAEIVQPCDVEAYGDEATFRPIDDIMEAERRFMRELEKMFDDAFDEPDWESHAVMGEPMVLPPPEIDEAPAIDGVSDDPDDDVVPPAVAEEHPEVAPPPVRRMGKVAPKLDDIGEPHVIDHPF